MGRILVTGLGVVSPLGRDLASFWHGLTSGRDTFAETPNLPGSGILVSGLDAAISFADLPLKSLAPLDPSGIYAVAAAEAALKDAGLGDGFADPTRVAVIIGNGAGGQMSIEEQYDRMFKQDRRTHPLTVVKAMVSSSASWVSIAFGAKGPAFVTSSACASATQAIGTAMQLIRAGIVDVAIAGGTEAPLNFGTICAWDAMKVLSRSKCRPFSRNREGLMLSEGAGMLILESEAHAKARGATAHAELAGFASSADAGDIVAPSADGMARAMQAAIADAGVSTSDVAYINAHGTATRQNDATEAEALKMVFGPTSVPPISSTKGVTGHALGAAGAIEAVATVLAIKYGIAPPTANYEEFDPACDLDVIPNVPRPMRIPLALSNSFAFGGINASLAFRQAA
jgi:nodulation protein E